MKWQIIDNKFNLHTIEIMVEQDEDKSRNLAINEFCKSNPHLNINHIYMTIDEGDTSKPRLRIKWVSLMEKGNVCEKYIYANTYKALIKLLINHFNTDDSMVIMDIQLFEGCEN